MTVRGGVGYQTLLDEANAEIESISAVDLSRQLESDDLVLVDLRDIRELQREGHLKDALHAPRGMLEFWIDPASPYHKPVFAEDKRFVLYCGSGWRSALATKVAQDMGLAPVCHIDGGYTAWKKAGLPVEDVTQRPA